MIEQHLYYGDIVFHNNKPAMVSKQCAPESNEVNILLDVNDHCVVSRADIRRPTSEEDHVVRVQIMKDYMK